MLARVACFAPGEPIPYDLLVATLGLVESDFGRRLKANDAANRLIQLGLIREEAERMLRCHRLIWQFVQAVAPDTILQDAQELVYQTLLEKAAVHNEAGEPHLIKDWQIHLRTTADAVTAQENEISSRLNAQLAWHLYQAGDYADARRYFQRAIVQGRQLWGDSRPFVARNLARLGIVHLREDNWELAWSLNQEALRLQEQSVGKKHADTAYTLNNLGYLQQLRRNFKVAYDYHRQAFRIRREVLGDNHPLIAESLSNLAFLPFKRGEFAVAEQRLRDALAVLETAVGEEHPETARILNYLAELHQRQENWEEAKTLFERVLTIRYKLLDPSHPDTLQTVSFLAEIDKVLGNNPIV